MIDMLSTAAGNAYKEGERYILNANKNGRLIYPFLVGPFFLLSLIALSNILREELINPIYDATLTTWLALSMPTAIFGYMSISYLTQLINIKELVLIQSEKKVQVRLERNKKVVSEHSRDDISLTKQRVVHEEPYRASMKWFTVFDTSNNKQLFCIRPGTRETDGMAVEELTSLFNAVMYPEQNAQKQQQEQKEIEERNEAMKEKYRKATDNASKWDSLT